jgi:hypothetical protein
MEIDYSTDCRTNPTELGYRLSAPPDRTVPTVPSILRILIDFGRRWVGPMAIALILFETIIRTFIYNPRLQVHDRLLGQIPAPGSTWVTGKEGFGRIHWNRQGIRGRDFPGAAARNVHRVVVVGDSFPMAEGVNDDQTFCARLENDLSRRLNQNVWIGNCGRAKLDAADFLCSVPAYDQKFNPELTVLTFNLSDFRVHDHLIAGLRAQFDPGAASGDGLIVQPLSGSTEYQPMKRGVPEPLQRVGRLLMDHSALAVYGGLRLYNAALREVPADANITRVEQIATVPQMERYFTVLLARSHAPVICASFRHYVTRTGQPANGFDNTIWGPGRGHLTSVGHRIVAEALAPRIARLLADPSHCHRLRVAQMRARDAVKGTL